MVGLHASSDTAGQPFPEFEIAERVGPVLFRAVIYTARTELFLIISLFLLVMSLDNRERGYGATIKEQARRLLVPFAFWVVFFAFYRLIKAGHFSYDGVIWHELSQPSSWASYFLLGNVQYHMHFLPTLFGLVLFFPLYRVAVDRPALGAIILVCLFCKREVDVWIWSTLKDMMGFEYLVRGVKLFTYAGYGIVAASFYGFLKSRPSEQALRQLFWASIYLALLLFTVKLVYSHRVILHGNWQYNFTPAYWADFLMPVALFGICMAAMNANWPPVISTMAPYSFGIYLVHPIFLDLLEIALWHQKLSPSLFVALKTGGAILGAAVFVWMLGKTRSLAWTVGLGRLPAFKRPEFLNRSKLLKE
ncbi:membrane protein [Amylibacter marinus]|uniref:Membrane protein n=2 Tax=Amylibacter marinus TaxID=1475483 RepID=A0ABQ5VVI9_9RHOB|nr:membrane protein [Amylibacter marinus]